MLGGLDRDFLRFSRLLSPGLAMLENDRDRSRPGESGRLADGMRKERVDQVCDLRSSLCEPSPSPCINPMGLSDVGVDGGVRGTWVDEDAARWRDKYASECIGVEGGVQSRLPWSASSAK